MRSALLILAVVVAPAMPSFAGEEPKPSEATLAASIKPTLLKTLPVSGRIGSLAFDSKGEKLVTVGWDTPGGSSGEMDVWKKGTSRGDIRIWNVASGAEIAHFGNELGGLFDVAFSPDDKTIITAGRAANSPRKGDVTIWDAQTHKPIRSLAGPTNWVICVACSSDGKLIAAGGFDRAIRIWEAATGMEVTSLKLPKLMPRSVRFSKDGKTLVAGYGTGSVSLFQVGTWDEVNTFEERGAFLLSADISPDGKHLIAAGAEEKPPPGQNQAGRIYVWDVATSREERVDRPDQLVSGVAFSPDGKYYATSGFVSRIWTTDKGEEVADLKRGGSTSGDAIRFSPDGKRLALGALNNVTVWDVSGLGATNRGK
ncbi:MAG TPA: WD40 repeat domain-containing protein [Planctomycetaceae bacterium]|jgi:WD40 repeat protein|nr:WD40 repeat domain-containing protein [Planctomycetaceae bacterium]